MLEAVCDWGDHGAPGGGWIPGVSEVDVRFVQGRKNFQVCVLSQFRGLFVSGTR